MSEREPAGRRGLWGRVLRRIVREVRVTLWLTGRAVWRAAVEFYNSDDLTYAASVGYYALLSLFPFFLIAFTILGTVTADETSRAVVIDFVLRYFPQQTTFVTRQLDALRQVPVTIGIGGLAGMVWAALGVFSAVSTAVNHAWGVEQQRSYLRHKLFSFLMLVASGALLVAALLLVSAIQIAEASWFAGAIERFPGLAFFTSLAARYATTMLLIIVVGLIFYFVPNAQVRFRDVWIGAVITGLLWSGALAAFSWYVRRGASHYTAVHGSIATVIVFLLWVYIASAVLLFGAEFTAAYARLRRHRPEELPAAPSPRA